MPVTCCCSFPRQSQHPREARPSSAGRPKDTQARLPGPCSFLGCSVVTPAFSVSLLLTVSLLRARIGLVRWLSQVLALGQALRPCPVSVCTVSPPSCPPYSSRCHVTPNPSHRASSRSKSPGSSDPQVLHLQNGNKLFLFCLPSRALVGVRARLLQVRGPLKSKQPSQSLSFYIFTQERVFFFCI